MKAFRFWGIPFLIAILVGTIAWLCFRCLPQSAFRDSFLGNLFATVIGVIVSIPIALGVYKFQETKEQESKELEKLKRSRKILALLERELEHNRDLLSHLIAKQENQQSVAAYEGLKNDLWRSFADSGDLHLIDSLYLLDSLTNAYYYIRLLLPLHEAYFEPSFLDHVTIVGTGENSYKGERLVERVIAIRPDALKATERALEKLRAHLYNGKSE